jgi:ribosomal protein S18 acetylase RimI-like enzyme
MSKARQARAADAREIGRIEVDTWRETYAGMVPDRVLIGMSVNRQAALWTHELRRGAGDVRVIEDRRGNLVGFGQCGAQRNGSLPYHGEIYTLYVSPDAQGRGIGRQLLLSLFGRLIERGWTSALVWVVEANPSRFFYERMGGKLAARRTVPVGGQPVDTLGYAWEDLPAVIARLASRAGHKTPR